MRGSKGEKVHAHRVVFNELQPSLYHSRDVRGDFCRTTEDQ